MFVDGFEDAERLDFGEAEIEGPADFAVGTLLLLLLPLSKVRF